MPPPSDERRRLRGVKQLSCLSRLESEIDSVVQVTDAGIVNHD